MRYPYSGVDLRKHPEAYSIGRGEQGVFHAEPYKSELLPLWTIEGGDAARKSSEAIYEQFEEYKAAGDFVGMDVARKFLRMGYMRSRRYAKYVGGRKASLVRSSTRRSRGPLEIFREKWRAAEDREYVRLKGVHRRRGG